jgi:cobaltochelatase CobS
MTETISCELCGQSIHAVQVHLSKEHGPEDSDPCTFAEYKERFPEAKLLSPIAERKLAERKADSSAVTETTEACKTSMADLFRLKKVAGATRANGDPIMISVMSQEESNEQIPSYRSDYVYNVDILKTFLMGFEIGRPMYAFGHSGTGKSSLFSQICSATKRAMIRLQHSKNTQEFHIIGQWIVVSEIHNGEAISVMKFQPGPLAVAMRYGYTFLADEFDRAYPSVTSVYNGVLEGNGEPLNIPDAPDEWRIVKPHENFRFVATGNTNGSGDDTGLYQATVQQDAATFERFSIVQEISHLPPEQEVAVIRSRAKVKAKDAEAIVKFATAIRGRFPMDVSLNLGSRVLVSIAENGVMKGDFAKGAALAYTNRLPSDERKAVNDLAQRYFGTPDF